MTLEDMANQLLLPILGDTDLTFIELSTKEEAVEAELKKEVNVIGQKHIDLFGKLIN